MYFVENSQNLSTERKSSWWLKKASVWRRLTRWWDHIEERGAKREVRELESIITSCRCLGLTCRGTKEFRDHSLTLFRHRACVGSVCVCVFFIRKKNERRVLCDRKNCRIYNKWFDNIACRVNVDAELSRLHSFRSCNFFSIFITREKKLRV